MHLIGPARLGKDAELRFMADGTPVANLALAFNYGPKDAEGKRATQWIDAALFGDRAQKLQPYLLKGTQIDVHLSDPHIETYTARDGSQGSKLVARLSHLEFVGSAPQQQGGQQTQPQQRQPAQSQREQNINRQHAQTGGGRATTNWDDMGDDIPFALDNSMLSPHSTSSQFLRAKNGRGLALAHDNGIEF